MLKKIKSLFIEEIEDAQPKKKSNPAPTRQTPPPVAAERTTVTTESRPGEVKDKFMKILFGAMDKANLDGFDYLEFKNSLQSLKKVQQTDEATRYQSAYAMAQTMGATPQNLVQTAEHYLNVLRQEEAKFEQALDANMQSKVGSQQAKVKQLAEDIKQKQAQIQKLQQEIDASKAEHEKIVNGIKSATAKIENTKADFIASYEAIRQQIIRDTDKIKKYLG